MTSLSSSARTVAQSASRTLWLCLALALGAPLATAQISLPVTFEDGAIDYELVDFGGNASALVADPEDASNTVVQSVRAADAACFAGTTVADASGFTAPIPFTADATTMSVRVWSPEAGVRVLWKVEQAGDPTVSVETVGFTTAAGAWETIVFDLGDERPGTAALNLSSTYTKASIFFEFSCDIEPPPPATPERTYYWDDVEFGGEATGGGIALPITFEDDMLDYELTDFGGNASQLVADPTDAANTVVESVRTAGAAFFAGTTVAEVTGFNMPIPFAPGATTMTLRVWSPTADTPVRLKVENVGDAGISVEAEVPTTVAGAWEMLTFDFTDEVDGTAPLNFDSDYTKASVFFNFGEEGATAPTTYYWDDLAFGGDAGGGGDIALPVDFEDDMLDYELVDFGGNASQRIADPTDASNTVVETVRTAGAAFFAGTTVGDVTGFTEPIPFAPGMTTMSVRVWAPAAGIPVRLKVENVGDAGVSVEAEVPTTVAGMWETLVYDFANEVTGTAPLNFDSDYTKASIFFNFGEEGATDPTTYYWDDLAFGGEVVNPAVVSLPVTFEEDIDYELTDFGGNASQLIADPTDAANTVVESVRTAGAAFFAGTTVAEVNGFTEAIPFEPGMTFMNVRVWAPAAGTPVRLKVEQFDDPTVSVEAEVQTTVAGMWETLVYDFTDQVEGTAPINFDAEYTKASLFFDFGEEGATEATTYYWDDLAFGLPPTPVVTLPVTFEDDIDYGLVDFGGNASALVEDPEDAENTVVETVRTAGAAFFAGTTVADALGFVEPIPFTETMTQMSIRVWTPAVGTAVRVKVEDVNDPEVSVETQVMSNVAGAWEGLTLNFANEFPGTRPIDFGAEYTKLSVFFDFGTEGATEATTYYWDDVAFGPAPVSDEAGAGAEVLALEQSFPNPFSADATIRFALPASDYVQLHVYNALGQRVATLADGTMEAGEHAVTLDGSRLASGTYFYRLSHGAESLVRSMVLAR